MGTKLFNRNLIESPDDLKHERSGVLVEKYGLDIKEILPTTLELDKKGDSSHQITIEINMKNPETPLNIHYTYIKEIACALVVQYELTKREVLRFPLSENPAIVKTNEGIFSASEKVTGCIKRHASIKIHELLIEQYENVIKLLETHREKSLERMCQD